MNIKIRKEEVVLARLRLGPTEFTYSYLLLDEIQPQCVDCDAPFTVRRFLLECGDFAQVRKFKQYFIEIFYIHTIYTLQSSH